MTSNGVKENLLCNLLQITENNITLGLSVLNFTEFPLFVFQTPFFFENVLYVPELLNGVFVFERNSTLGEYVFKGIYLVPGTFTHL